jgi:predicted house-cleaning NTP pyrophosphatase (Maf/HAM1 superfamily)
MYLGEFDPESTHDFDQVVETVERLDFVVFVDQKVTAAGALLEKHNPLSRIRRVLDDMGGRDQALYVALPYLLSLHRDSRNENAVTA